MNAMPRCRSPCTFSTQSLDLLDSWIFGGTREVVHRFFGSWSLTVLATSACFALAGLLTLAYHHRRYTRELRRRSTVAAIRSARRQQKKKKKPGWLANEEDPLLMELSTPFTLLSIKQQQIAAEQIQRLYEMALAAWTTTQNWQSRRRQATMSSLLVAAPVAPELVLSQAGSNVPPTTAEVAAVKPRRAAQQRRRRAKLSRVVHVAAASAFHAKAEVRAASPAEYSVEEPTTALPPEDDTLVTVDILPTHAGGVTITVRVGEVGLGVLALTDREETVTLRPPSPTHTLVPAALSHHQLTAATSPATSSAPTLPLPPPTTTPLAASVQAPPHRRAYVHDRQMVLQQPPAQSAAEQQCHLLLQELNTSAAAWLQHLAARYRPKSAAHQRMEEWSGRRVVSFGSLRLGAWTTASDVDALILGPPWLPRHVFFGRSYDQDGFVPFFMRSLKQRHHILSSVVYLPDAHVPVIRLRYGSLGVDLLYCQTPFLDPAATPITATPSAAAAPLPVPLSLAQTALAPLSRWGGNRHRSGKGASAAGEVCGPSNATFSAAVAATAVATVGAAVRVPSGIQETMPSLAVVDAWLPFLSVKDALSLSGWRCTETVLHLVSQLGTKSAPCLDSFRRVLVGVKEWARKWGIYGQNFGYLGGVSWALLVLYAMQQTPPAQRNDVVCIFRTFLETFRTWSWERRAVDVLLPLDGSPDTPTPSSNTEGCTPSNNYAATNCMTIQTPLDARDTINAAFLVNRHTLAVIRRAFELTATEALARNLTASLSPSSPTTGLVVTAPTTIPSPTPTTTAAAATAVHGSIHLLLAASDSGRLHTWTGWVESRIRHLQQWLLQQEFVESAAPWPTWWPMPPVPMDVETRQAREYWPRNDLAVALVVRATGQTTESVRESVEQFLSTFSQDLCRKQSFAAFQFERMFLRCHFVLATDP
jgi:hypothetical protein